MANLKKGFCSIADICRKMGLTPYSHVAIKKDLDELGYARECSCGDRRFLIPESQLNRVIKELKELRSIPEGFISVKELASRTGKSDYVVREYIRHYKLLPLKEYTRLNVYLESDPLIISFLRGMGGFITRTPKKESAESIKAVNDVALEIGRAQGELREQRDREKSIANYRKKTGRTRPNYEKKPNYEKEIW